MSAIMVTGAGGWIGSYVLDELRRRGHYAYATGEVASATREIYALDITDAPAVRHMVTEIRPDAIINLAGVLGTEELLSHEAPAALVNVVGALNVFDAARIVDARVVQIGTGHRGQPNTYAVTKACAEDLGLIRAANLGQPITIVRAYHAYGPGQSIPPPHGRARVRKIIPSFACRALTGMPIEIFGNGENLIDLVYVGDVASALVDAAENGQPGEIRQAGTGHALRVSDVAQSVIDRARTGVQIVYEAPRPGEPVGARAVADKPVCGHPWPHAADITMAYYAEKLGVA